MKKRKIITSVIITVLSIGIFGALAVTNNILDLDSIDFIKKVKEDQANKSVVAIVNGENIYRSSIDIQREIYKYNKSRGTKQIEEMQISEEEKQKWQSQNETLNTKTDKEILDQLIREEVMLQEANKKGLQASDEEVYNKIKENYELSKEVAAKKDATDDDKYNYLIIVEYMKARNMTEDAYFVEAGNTYKQEMTKYNLYLDFTKNNSAEISKAVSQRQDESSQSTLPQQYESDQAALQQQGESNQTVLQQEFQEYIDTLVKNSDIQYINS